MSKERTRADRPRQSEGVRAFKRGLDVLQEVNRSGGIRAGDVARALDLPRPTVYRLLETLEELGYVARSASDDRFRVTRRALSLGDGYDPGVVICQAAAPFLAELSKILVWPVDLSTYENAAMVVQETTHSRSPLSIDRGMIGKRLPMLRTSAGRAYLAACPARERDLIVGHLRRIDEADDRPFLDEARLDRMIVEVQAQGYAIRSEGEYNPKTASIAVPIVRNGAVYGCISIIWIRSALRIEEAVAQFASQLQETAAAIPVEV
ncbi:DNA-binding transcriptional regulator [Bradyrhizobium betae]|uniref:DNA-binding transcriptional regulator n=1 Tax=Bradyrhizobium betae TaxID=244734 RepID=A0A5P6PED8_9BRAD|nr:DNA-binding transcriptional regulator [Bradyrhizobium betae]MCS3730736.1 IclR family mhp operon transcriptional activator [Bradyrhizobium betae]QFI76244.1 DNA-binding transcriptional regulator [Bradyrhizobium betae]